MKREKKYIIKQVIFTNLVFCNTGIIIMLPVIQSPKIVLLSVGSLESGKKHKEIQSPKIVLLSVGSFKFGNY